ncbi:unnamed protein product, partial [Iphiclides podalirius]
MIGISKAFRDRNAMDCNEFDVTRARSQKVRTAVKAPVLDPVLVTPPVPLVNTVLPPDSALAPVDPVPAVPVSALAVPVSVLAAPVLALAVPVSALAVPVSAPAVPVLALAVPVSAPGITGSVLALPPANT